MDILPAIDLRNGKCVRLVQGDYDRQIDYDEDPTAVARQFEDAGARWIHIVDLDGAREGAQRNLPAIRAIRDATGTAVAIEVGGGIRDADAVSALLDAGVSRVIVGTRALEDWAWFEQLANTPAFAGRIVLSLDAKEGRLATRGWETETTLSAIDVAERVGGWPLAAIIYTDISRDGMLLGPNLDAVRGLVGVSALPVIAAGGVTDLDDVKRLAELPLAGIIIGRALYENTITLTDALAAVQQNGPTKVQPPS